MICPHCDRETASASPVCAHCGGALDITFDRVLESADKEATRLARERPEELGRALLLWAAALLLIAATARALLVPAGPAHLVEPAHLLAPAGAFGTQPAGAFGTQPAGAFGTSPADGAGPATLELEAPPIEVPTGDPRGDR